MIEPIDGVMPVSARTSFNSPQLIRFLADLDVVDVAESKQSFAERLSLWLDWTDAISLSAALNGAQAAGPSDARSGAASRARAVTEEFTRVRRELAQSITTAAVFSADTAGPAAPGAPADDGADFSPCRRHYLAHQRAMDSRIGPLRASVRSALSALSPDLAGLAALDAVLDKALGARERHLLSTVPVLLEKHFERLCKGPPGTPAPAQDPNPPDPGQRSARWLAAFGQHVQGVLLAELDLRLQPIEGMIDALGRAATRQP